MAVLETPRVGDDAFERLCREHRDALLALCRRRLGPERRADAEDACQEALLRAYRALPRVDPTRPLWPWLATIAANVCTDLHRRRRLEPVGDAVLVLDDGAPDLDDVVALRTRRAAVASAIGELPQRYRRHVWLADVAGWSYADIAEHERTSVAAVRSTLLRGRRALRTRLHELRAEGRIWTLPVALPLLRLRRRFDPVLGEGATLAQAAAVAVAAVVVGVVAPAGTTATATATGEATALGRPAAVLDAGADPRSDVPAAAERSVAHEAGERAPALDLPGGAPPRIDASSHVDLDGRWRIAHVEVRVDHDLVPVSGGVSWTLDCAREQTWCGRAEEALRRP